MNNDLRKQAEEERRAAEAAYHTSEYPRTGRHAHLSHAEALEAMAEATEGKDETERSERMTGEQRRADRAERLRLKAAARQVEAARLNVEAHKLASVVPFGQPILVGHHSERGHRRLLDKVGRKTDQSITAHREAERLEGAADRVASSGAILAQDSDAEEQLAEKIERLTAQRDGMKAVNAALRALTRKKNPTREHFYKIGWTDAQIDQAETMSTPYESWQLQNIGARIKTAQERLERIRHTKATASEAGDEEVNGVKIVRNVEDNRLQLLFPDKPSADTRSELKRMGYRWSPRNSAWQRHLNTLRDWQMEQTRKVLESWT